VVYAAAAAMIGLLRGSFRATSTTVQPSATLRAEIAEGFRWFWQHRLLHIMGIKSGIEHGCWAATNAVLVLIAQDRLGVDAAGFGALVAAGAIGGVVGGITANWLIIRLGAGGASLLNMALQGIAYFGIALSTNLVVVSLMLVVLSYTGSIGGVVGSSFRQAIIPDRLQRRVTSAFRLYALGGMSIGALVGGLLAGSFGLLTPYWLSGAALLIMTIALVPIVNNRTMSEARQQAQLVDHSARCGAAELLARDLLM
jgi:MFS family permease